MLDALAAKESFRQRAAAVVVVTTGIINDLSATTAGFARASGSFITDGFADGMELHGTGFNAGNNLPLMIKGQVLTGLLPVAGLTVQPIAAGRTLSVGIPSDRRWENTQPINPPAPGGRPYITDQWGASTIDFKAGPVEGGYNEEEGTYYLTWFGLGNIGIPALYREIAALKALFMPGTKIAVGSLFIRVGARGPRVGQLTPLENGMAYIQLSIPWRCASVNAVAA